MRVLQLATSPRSYFEGQVDALESLGIECTVVTVPNAGSARGPREYLHFARRAIARGIESFDLVHANYGLTAPLALALPTRPVVVTLWGTDVTGPRWLRQLSLTAASRADAAVVPWEGLSRELEFEHHVVPFGVDTDRFRPLDRSEARERLGWPDGDQIVLFPYDPRRRVKDYPRAERVVDGLSVDAELRVVSGAPHAQMPLYLNASDALLVTSVRESGPMAVLEAAACNVPVVSSDVGVVAEVLADVSNSFVARDEADLVEALEVVLEGSGRSNGRAAVEEFELDAVGDRLLSVYRSACRSD